MAKVKSVYVFPEEKFSALLVELTAEEVAVLERGAGKYRVIVQIQATPADPPASVGEMFTSVHDVLNKLKKEPRS